MVRDSHEAGERRRAQRARWPIVRHRLGEEPIDDLSATTTPAERVAMMWPLALRAWEVAGRPLPNYDRQSLPARLFRAGAPRPPDDDS
jgi:hypothetical protein